MQYDHDARIGRGYARSRRSTEGCIRTRATCACRVACVGTSRLRKASREAPVGDSISEVLASIPGWLKDGSYHLDTSHLASTVRFARVLDDREFLALAHDLSEYGRQLHPQYQYPGDEPFGDLYASSSAFFAVLLGKQVEFGLRLFLQKAESLDPQEHGTIAIETYADLLARVNRPADAIAFLIKRMPQGMRPCGVAPSLLELSQQANDFSLMLDQAKTRGDAVGYAAAILQRASIGGGAEKS